MAQVVADRMDEVFDVWGQKLFFKVIIALNYLRVAVLGYLYHYFSYNLQLCFRKAHVGLYSNESYTK